VGTRSDTLPALLAQAKRVVGQLVRSVDLLKGSNAALVHDPTT
jgi:hypothetical protein